MLPQLSLSELLRERLEEQPAVLGERVRAPTVGLSVLSSTSVTWETLSVSTSQHVLV